MNLRWGMAVHNSHYGLIQDNVAWNYNGFLCGTEDGSKSYNVFDQNFAVRSNGFWRGMAGQHSKHNRNVLGSNKPKLDQHNAT